jgi:hypothetical protein
MIIKRFIHLLEGRNDNDEILFASFVKLKFDSLIPNGQKEFSFELNKWDYTPEEIPAQAANINRAIPQCSKATLKLFSVTNSVDGKYLEEWTLSGVTVAPKDDSSWKLTYEDITYRSNCDDPLATSQNQP